MDVGRVQIKQLGFGSGGIYCCFYDYNTTNRRVLYS
jgi:hypothetical protein